MDIRYVAKAGDSNETEEILFVLMSILASVKGK